MIFDKSDYQKQCEKRIKELCGGFIVNESFKKKAMLLKFTDYPTNTFETSILKSECKNAKLPLEDIESRLDELLEMDCDALNQKIRIGHNKDTSLFKTQSDIDRYMGA